MLNKKGVFFSTDALIALMIIFLSILIIYPVLESPKKESFIQEDLIFTLSSLKVGEMTNGYVLDLITQGIITDSNKSTLEQIGEFYITDISIARDLAEIMISDFDNEENIGIWYGSTLLASKNVTSIEDSEEIVVGREIISGIQEGESVTGFSARSFLSNSLQTKYFYFGGYVGEGNLSATINYNGDINSASMELAINKNFSLYINGVYNGNFEKSDSSFSP